MPGILGYYCINVENHSLNESPTTTTQNRALAHFLESLAGRTWGGFGRDEGKVDWRALGIHLGSVRPSIHGEANDALSQTLAEYGLKVIRH